MVTAPPTGSGWEALSEALTDEAPVLAERDDLTVAIVPGAGQGSPACLLPALARIEIDGTHLGVDPATAHPARPGRPLPLPDRVGAVRARMRPRPPHRLDPHPRRRAGRGPRGHAAGGVPDRGRAHPPPP